MLFETAKKRTIFQQHTNEDLVYDFWSIKQQCFDDIKIEKANDNIKNILEIIISVGLCMLAMLILIIVIIITLCCITIYIPEEQEVTFNREPRVDDVQVRFTNRNIQVL